MRQQIEAVFDTLKDQLALERHGGRTPAGVYARTARHGRGHVTTHPPGGWHRRREWLNLGEATCGPPATAA